jgi:glycerol-3-phosphate cytidylyltransferase
MSNNSGLEDVVITYGTFDMFHIGHLNLLNRAKAMGRKLIVGVSTDEFNEVKGKKTLIPYEHRAEIVSNIKCVDLVIPETHWGQKTKDVVSYNVNLFVIGDDWKGEFDILREHCDVRYLSRTADISTTKLKNSLTNFLSIPREDILNAFDILAQLKNDLE